jgi:hypothetical protein
MQVAELKEQLQTLYLFELLLTHHNFLIKFSQLNRVFHIHQAWAQVCLKKV